jgi:hypothetical protein
MERHRRIAVAFLAAAFLLASCSDDDAGEASAEDIEPIEDAEPETEPEVESEPKPEPVEDPEPEPEPAEVDITVVPDEISEEYIEAVLAELEGLYLDAYVAFRVADEPNIEATDRLGSAFANAQYAARLNEFVEFASEDYEGLQPAANARPRAHIVEEIHDLSDDCVYVETLMDVSGVVVGAGAPQVTFVELGPREVERVVDLNSTPWLIHGLPIGELAELREVRPCDG